MADRLHTGTGFPTLRVVVVLILACVFVDGWAGRASAESVGLGSAGPSSLAESDPFAVKNGWNVDVNADERLRYRTSPDTGESDNDLRLYVDIAAFGPGDRFCSDAAFWLWTDLDGVAGRDEVTSFSSPQDAEGKSVWFDLLRLTAEVRSSGFLKRIRGGRQVAEQGEPITFDGATLTLQPWAPYLEAFILGGRTVHFFEIDPGLFEDWLVGGGFRLRPFSDLRIDLDYRFEKEDTTAASGIEDSVAGLTASFRHRDWLKLKGSLRTLNGDLYEAGGALQLVSLKKELGLDLFVQAQTVTLREVSEQEDPYFSILGESLPHVRFRADAWKSFPTRHGVYLLQLGYEGRELTQDEETAFNRNSARAYGVASVRDVWLRGLFLSASIERWGEGPGLDQDGLWALGGSGGYDGEAFRCEVGTSYQRYKLDFYRDLNERDNVRTFFLDLRWKPFVWLSVIARYEFERFDRDIHTVTVGLAQRFSTWTGR